MGQEKTVNMLMMVEDDKGQKKKESGKAFFDQNLHTRLP